MATNRTVYQFVRNVARYFETVRVYTYDQGSQEGETDFDPFWKLKDRNILTPARVQNMIRNCPFGTVL